jgi:SAM-dependent methyltransferase
MPMADAYGKITRFVKEPKTKYVGHLKTKRTAYSMKIDQPDRQNVQLYFDRIADTYPERYRHRRSFHARFFNERLQLATEGCSFAGKTIWDIGAGTGALYDLIGRQTDNFEYFACDLSEKMLAQSRIPPERRQVGSPYWQQFPDQFFDHIFLLGVTTYLPGATLAEWLAHIQQKLKPTGRLIVSFTNRASWEYHLRRRTRPLLQRLARTDQLINQSFEAQAYEYDEAVALLAPFFQLRRKQWLHVSVPFLSRLWPALSSWLGRRLARSLHLHPQLSTDFLLVLEAR